MAGAIAQRPPARTTGRTYLFMAAGFAVLAGLLAFAALRDGGDGGASATGAIATLPRVVAIEDIPVRTRITEEMVRVQAIPTEGAQLSAFAVPESAIGLVTRFPIAANEQIGPQKVGVTFESGEEADTGLSFVIPPGYRAVSISISEPSAVAGLIVAGDRVDVIALFDEKLAGIEKAVTVLQNVEVLSVAQIAQEPVPPPVLTDEEAAAAESSDVVEAEAAADEGLGVRPIAPLPQPGARTITFAVLLEDAQMLALVEQHASWWLTLRAFDDDETVTLSDSSLLPLGVLHPDLRN
jgi:pilus assembly protein CpaB